MTNGRRADSKTSLEGVANGGLDGHDVADDDDDAEDHPAGTEKAPLCRQRSASLQSPHGSHSVNGVHGASGLRKRQVSVGGASYVGGGGGKRGVSESGSGGVLSRSSSKTRGVNSQTKLSPTPSESAPNRQQQQQHKQPAPPPKVTQYRSIISDVFDGRILSSVQCLTCDRVSTTVENFQDLSLPIPSRDHLSAIHHSASAAAAAVASSQQQGGAAVGPGSASSSSSGVASAAAATTTPTVNVGQSLAAAKASSCGDLYYGSSQGWIPWMVTWFKSWFWGPVITLHNCLQAFFRLGVDGGVG